MTKATIMIVEDEIITAKDIERSLVSAGYSFFAIVVSGEEALKKAAEIMPDLVLMDIILKGTIDGIDAAHSIRCRYDIPVIFLTSHADNGTLQRAKAAEPYGYIIKPFQEKDLLVTIEIALYKSMMDKRLRESERWLDTILRGIGDAVIATDSFGRIKFVNPMAEALTGWSREEASGKGVAEIYHIITECDRSPAVDPVTKVIEEGTVLAMKNNIVLLPRYGGEAPVEQTATPIRDSCGNITGAVLVFHDISERRKAETEKARLEEQLRHAQKMEAIGQLAGGIAHDFNNMLSVIIGYGNLLHMNMEKDDTQRCNVVHILSAAEKAAILTKGLLTFSRKQAMALKPVNLNAIIRNLEKLLTRLIGENIELKTRLTKKQIDVIADEGQLGRVLMNLVTNARDAMPDGGSIEIETGAAGLNENHEGLLPAGTPWEYAIITVSDTGKGMDNATQAKIFEPFFTTKGLNRGTGLGLAIVYGIIKQHNGAIHVFSEPSRGTTFRIYLPLARLEGAGEAVKGADRQTHMPGGSETILIAEDDASLRKLEKQILETFGYKVVLAENGEDAVEKFIALQAEIDLLLLDLIMPKKSGMEVYAIAKKMRPDIKALFMSGYSANLMRKRDVPEEGLNFIVKPVFINVLLKKVREVLDMKKFPYLTVFDDNGCARLPDLLRVIGRTDMATNRGD